MVRLRILAAAMPVAFFLTIAALFRGAVAAPDPGSMFMMELRDQAIAQLADSAISEQERQLRFQALLRKNFNLPFVSRFVLGRYWNKAEDSARTEFIVAFESYIAQRFLPFFAEYKGRKIEIGEAKDPQNGGDIVSVGSKISRDEGEPILITWRLQQTADGYKIIDVVTAGLSMAVTLRSEFASVLKANGGDLRDTAKVLRSKLTQRSAATKQQG